MDLGQTVSPTNSNDPTQQNRPQAMASVPDAIRILSFRVPSVVGANSPIPQGLLGGPQALGPQFSNLLTQNWLRLLLSGQMGQQGQSPTPGRFGFPNEARTQAPMPGGMQGTHPPAPPTLGGNGPGVSVTPGSQGGRDPYASETTQAQTPPSPPSGLGGIRNPFSRGA